MMSQTQQRVCHCRMPHMELMGHYPGPLSQHYMLYTALQQLASMSQHCTSRKASTHQSPSRPRQQDSQSKTTLPQQRIVLQRSPCTVWTHQHLCQQCLVHSSCMMSQTQQRVCHCRMPHMELMGHYPGPLSQHYMLYTALQQLASMSQHCTSRKASTHQSPSRPRQQDSQSKTTLPQQRIVLQRSPCTVWTHQHLCQQCLVHSSCMMSQTQQRMCHCHMPHMESMDHRQHLRARLSSVRKMLHQQNCTSRLGMPNHHRHMAWTDLNLHQSFQRGMVSN